MKSNSKETNRIKEPSKFTINFANTVFVLGILFSVLILVYAVYKINNPAVNVTLTFYYSSLLFAVLIAFLFVLGLRKLSDELKVNLSVMFVIIGIVFYGFETYLGFYLKSPQREVIALQMGVPYDTRTYIEVLNDLRDSGVEAFPNTYPLFFFESNGLTAKKGRIYPLGTISNSTTILSNEAGYYPIIETDEHGFNNPKGLYIENKVDIVLTGDSFTEGYSVHSDETISAVLRELDFNAISVGKVSNGPLTELATLKEYAEPLKPKIILWVYFLNDIDELINEVRSSFLLKYMNEGNFSQNLISRQEEIDDVLKNYVQVEWGKQKNKDGLLVFTEKERIIDFIQLNNIRTRLNLIPTFTSTSTPKPIFINIMQKAQQMVSGWNGRIYFVYLPAFEQYSTGYEDINREFVLRTATELDIPIIDVYKEAFEPHPDPLSLVPFRISGHYNAEGYRLVAEAISKRLVADGFSPSNLDN